MIECEDAAIERGEMSDVQRLSGPMKNSWESGDFWIMYAASHSFAFDAIYWQKIDPRFFGRTNDHENAWKERLVLLSDDDHAEMESLVAQKLGKMRNRELAWDCDEYTRFLEDRMTNAHECKASEATDGPSEHSLESVHSMAMFQAILDFAAKKNTTAQITEIVKTQEVEMEGPQAKEGDTEDILIANVARKDAKGGSGTQVLSDRLAKCSLAAW
jgi:hypothetical protein